MLLIPPLMFLFRNKLKPPNNNIVKKYLSLFLVIALILLSLFAYQIYHVQKAKAAIPTLLTHTIATSATLPMTTLGIDTTGATILIAGVAGGQLASSVKDSNGNLWIQAVRSSSPNTFIFYSFSSLSGGPLIISNSDTLTYSGTSGQSIAEFAAFSGTAFNQDALNKTTTIANSGGGNSATLPALTPSVNNTLIVSFIKNFTTGGSILTNNDLTIIDSTTTPSGILGGFAYLVQNPASSISPIWSWTGSVGLGYGVAEAIFSPINLVTRLSLPKGRLDIIQGRIDIPGN